MKYLIGVGLFLIFVVVAIVLLVARMPGSNQESRRETERVARATDYATSNSRVIYTLQGPIVGQDARRSVRIIINSTSRTIEQIDGYQDKVVKSQTYTNNNEAYVYFLSAIDKLGFTNERRTRQTDRVGACATGQVYIFQVEENSEIVMDRWSASCGRGLGTFGGTTSTTRILFERQITDYTQFVKGINL